MKNIMKIPSEFPVVVWLGDDRIEIKNSIEFCQYLDRCAKRERVNSQSMPERLKSLKPTHSEIKV